MNLTPSQKRLLLILAMFFIPLGISMAWYYSLPADYKPGSSTNNGTLISPVYTLQDFSQPQLKGPAFAARDMERIWTIVHLLDGACDEACSKRLYDTRQLRIALAEDMDRVQRVLVAATPQVAEQNARMWESHPDLHVLIGSSGGLGEQVRATATRNHYPPGSIYLVDPLGNLMMQFGPAIPAKQVMKDIEKLLRLSHIGQGITPPAPSAPRHQNSALPFHRLSAAGWTAG
ncbi:MAG TPA: hypothetical protein PLB10_09145 [Thiolinea sp.]|nr:hypothetical protein [Thiolinea sp.]